MNIWGRRTMAMVVTNREGVSHSIHPDSGMAASDCCSPSFCDRPHPLIWWYVQSLLPSGGDVVKQSSKAMRGSSSLKVLVFKIWQWWRFSSLIYSDLNGCVALRLSLWPVVHEETKQRRRHHSGWRGGSRTFSAQIWIVAHLRATGGGGGSRGGAAG